MKGVLRNRLLRRLGAWLLTVGLVHALAFLLVRSTRGGPFDEERQLPAEVEQALRDQYHLDEPLWQQYARSVWGLFQGDFGPSMRYRDISVGQILRDAAPYSLTLGGGALCLALFWGVPAGLMAAHRRNRWQDQCVRAATSLALAVPNFVLAGIGILIFAFALNWLPPAGSSGPRYFLLPVVCLALPFAAQIARISRTAALEVLDSHAVRTAQAKGLSQSELLRRHVMPQTLVPVTAFMGPAAAGLLTGSIVIEQVFAMPGLGAHFVQAALNRDYTLALGVTVVYTALLGAFTLCADLLVERLDPRIKALS